MSHGFEDLAASLPPALAAEAYASPALADAYWRARKAGHDHASLDAQARALGTAGNPIGLLVTRLRRLADMPPPAQRAGGPSRTTHHKHRACPDQHDGCELCLCDPKASTHHRPIPMPDWVRQAWNELRVERTGLMP